MTETDRYFWDLNGYLILRNVLTDDQKAAANTAVEYYSDQIRVAEDNQGARGSDRLKGTGRPTLHGLLQLEKPYCLPFRQMLVHPLIVQHMNEMSGPGWRLDHGPLIIAGVKGTVGLTLHGAGEPHATSTGYHHQNGASYCGGITVQWQLGDVNAGDGGFCCVPGSHKVRYPMPTGVRTVDDDMGTVVQPAMKAGDVLFFMDGALTHGTLPWNADRPRRSVLYKFAGRTTARTGPAKQVSAPETYWDESIVSGMTEVQRAVMYGPYSNYGADLPTLDVTDDGEVVVRQGR
jgi:hypothetical protein